MHKPKVDWDQIQSQIAEMGKKTTNLNRVHFRLKSQKSEYVSERKDLERHLIEIERRAEKLHKSDRNAEQKLQDLCVERNVVQHKIAVLTFQQTLGRCDDEKIRYEVEKLEGIQRMISITLQNVYNDPEGLTLSQLHELLLVTRDRISHLTAAIATVDKDITKTKKEIRQANSYTDRRLLRKTEVVDFSQDGDRTWITIMYHVLQLKTKDVNTNIVYYMRKEETMGRATWFKLRTHSTLTNKKIDSFRKLRELEHIFKDITKHM